MSNRRIFLKQVTAAGIAAGMPSLLFSQQQSGPQMIWANLIHLSRNMWSDYRPELDFDESIWNTLLKEMAAAGMNMVIIDMGDGVQYESHPEIAVRNAWTPEKLKSELAKLRRMGLEPIPKMNFATTHDLWLGEYERMVSTSKYYSVCRDLIAEVIELFDYPRFFHLGMDEETAHHQRKHDYVVIRQNDLWWGDLYFYIGEVEKKGVRSWIWSDYGWHNPEKFFKKMPKSVLQSNWYYGSRFDWDTGAKEGEKLPNWRTYVKMYNDLEEHGYDQIPTGSNWSNDENFEATVEYCKDIIDPSRLLGFLMAPWGGNIPENLERHQKAISQVARAMKNY